MAEIKMYTLDEIAGILKVTRRSLYTWISKGQLKAVKIGKYLRVSEQALQEFTTIGTKG